MITEQPPAKPVSFHATSLRFLRLPGKCSPAAGMLSVVPLFPVYLGRGFGSGDLARGIGFRCETASFGSVDLHDSAVVDDDLHNSVFETVQASGNPFEPQFIDFQRFDHGKTSVTKDRFV
jgi:hypothetical protein